LKTPFTFYILPFPALLGEDRGKYKKESGKRLRPLRGGADANVEPVFSIKSTEKQLALLEKIQEYLENNLGFDLYSMHKLNCSSIFIISVPLSPPSPQPPLCGSQLSFFILI